MAGTVMTHLTSLLSNSPPDWSLNSCRGTNPTWHLISTLLNHPIFQRHILESTYFYMVFKHLKYYLLPPPVCVDKVSPKGKKTVGSNTVIKAVLTTFRACSLKNARAYANISRAFTLFPFAAWRSVSMERFWLGGGEGKQKLIWSSSAVHVLITTPHRHGLMNSYIALADEVHQSIHIMSMYAERVGWAKSRWQYWLWQRRRAEDFKFVAKSA